MSTDAASVRAAELEALLAVAARGSFVKAAADLKRHPTIVSKRIGTLEDRLGVRLLERTTRKVRLTDAGAALASRAGEAARIVADAEREAAAGASELRGRLRLAFPAAMGRRWLAPLMPDFARRHPGLDLDVHYAERHVDLIGEEFDAALRLGALGDNRLVSRKLGEHRIVLGASPSYLAEKGTPTSPAALRDHNTLRYTGPVLTSEWRLRRGASREVVVPTGEYRSNDIDALLEAARRGIGVVAFEWSMARDFGAGTLVRLLPTWRFETDDGIHLVRPSGRFMPRRTEAFVAWIVDRFKGGPPWMGSDDQ